MHADKGRRNMAETASGKTLFRSCFLLAISRCPGDCTWAVYIPTRQRKPPPSRPIWVMLLHIMNLLAIGVQDFLIVLRSIIHIGAEKNWRLDSLFQ